MKQPKEVLKTYFETGDKPTEQEFCDLIDSYYHQDSGLIISNISMNDDGEKVISFSDGTSVTIEETRVNDQQDNRIRTIDLGDITVYSPNSELDINQAVANRFNQLPDTIRLVSEIENIVVKANINTSFGS